MPALSPPDQRGEALGRDQPIAAPDHFGHLVPVRPVVVPLVVATWGRWRRFGIAGALAILIGAWLYARRGLQEVRADYRVLNPRTHVGEVLQAVYRVDNHDWLGKPWIELFQEVVIYGVGKKGTFKPRADFRLLAAEMTAAK
jgi:hypothetical protein